MATELRITWVGTAPGLAQHRLSVSAFGDPLALLLAALRRIAHQMVTNATEGEAVQRGRLVAAAKNLDIEIVNIKHNSSGVDALVTFHYQPAQVDSYATLVERVVDELLDDIERESKAQPANSGVRRYLRSLPSGITRQVYEVYDGGQQRKIAEIGEVSLSELPPDLPYLSVSEGNIVGVSFEPGRAEIRIKTGDTGLSSIAATREQVEEALQLRNQKVRAITVEGKPLRLISLKPAEGPRFKFDAATAKRQIFERWDNVLKQLAK